MKYLIFTAFILALAGCASVPNYQLDCEQADGRLSKCASYPWYVGGQCSRVK